MDAPPAMIVPGQMNVSATGAFTYTIPIAVPPGTAGMVPALSLDYSSQNGDGIVGMGWALSGLPSINRCPRTLAQDGVHGGVNFDANDRFCMEGQRLVAITGTYGADGTEYRTEIEGFSKIVSHGTAGSGPAWFEVHTKSGQIMEFGNSADSKGALVAAGCTLRPGPCSTTGPAGTVRLWAVNKISDTVGNYLTVTYDNGTQDAVNGQVYPTRIDYTGNAAAALTPFISVQFVYTSRNDQIPTYQAGAFTNTTVLLTNIQTYVSANLVSDYRLAYTTASSGADVDKLSSVTQCDGSTTPKCLAPTTFDWQGGTVSQPTASPAPLAQGETVKKPNSIGADYMGDGLTDATVLLNRSDVCPYFLQSINYGAGNGTTFTPSGITVNYGSHSTTGLMNCNGTSTLYVLATFLLDLDGDGLMDVMEADVGAGADKTVTNNYSILHNDGVGHMTSLNYMSISNYKGIHIGDFNGDGRSDIYSQQLQYALLSNGDGSFGFSGTTLLDPDPNMSILLDGDFDGDGCTDLLTQQNQARLHYFCEPQKADVLGINGYTHSGFTPTIGDFNGDGKADILWTHNGDTGKLWLSTGTGFVEVNSSIPAFNCDCYVFTGDWNGDGRTDIARTPTKSPGGNIEIFLSTGTGFVDAGTFGFINDPGDHGIQATASDWNNDGGPDLWVQLGLATSGDTEYLFTFKPITMVAVHNGIGSTIAVTYDRLNKNGSLYTKCPNNPASDVCGDAYPTQDIDGPLYVVSRIDLSNGVGGTYSSTYSYAGAKADLTGRGFLGFSSVKITDLQTNIAQTTNYRTDFPFIGLVASQTKTHGTVTLNSTANTYADTSPGTSTDGVARHFVSLTKSVAAANDLDGTVLPTTTTNYTYDAFGNALTVNVSVSDGSSKNTSNTYTNDTANWFLGRLTRSSVTSTVGTSTLTRTSSFAYDATTGLLTQEVVEPDDPAHRLQTDYTYDVFGHKLTATVSGLNVATRTATSTYDFNGQFEIKRTNALGQSESWTWSGFFGVKKSQTDFNGLTTSFTNDTFGRPNRQSNPDGTAIAFDQWYCSGVNGGTGSCFGVSGAYLQNTVPIGANGVAGPSQHIIYDSLSRSLAHSQQGFNGDGDYAYTQYDANGRVGQTSRPVDTGLGNTPKWTVFAYDDLGRVVKATAPDGSVTTTAYHGLTTSVTNDKGQTTTTVKNAQGLVASVTDAAGHATTYQYDAFGDQIRITDAAGNATANAYDIRGHKISSSDPDMGNWTYSYDVLGELTSQTDAKGQTVNLTYDKLGRLTQRVEGGVTTTWTYDTAVNGVGKLASVSTSDGSSRSFAYDTLSRPVTTTITTDGTAYTYTIAYNANNGNIDTVKYPSGLSIKYNYDANFDSYLASVTDAVSGQTYFTVNSRDAELHLTGATLGNGVGETQSFDPNTGLVQQILAGTTNSVANFHYVFDTLGNLKQRQDTVEGTTENFCYDGLNRLTNYALGGTTCTTGTAGEVKSVSYDAIGNILSKSDVGTYSYGAAHPHAVASVTGIVNGVANPTFAYDANGNMTSGAGRTVTWTAFNMVAQIVQGTTTVSFVYDGDHNRIKMTVGGASTVWTRYLNDPVSGAMAEKFVSSGGTVTTWRSYIVVDGKIVAEKFFGQTNAMRYFVLDHLGSVAVVTDETGAVTERLSYDAWGQRRCANGTGDATCFTGSATTRGFTNQEEIDQVGLVNLNARIYDPVLGRFMSADDVVPDVFSPQTLNRYSYVGNNPLSFTDPTGHIFGIDDLLAFVITTAIIIPVVHNIPILSSIATILAGLECGPGCAGAAAAESTGLNGGKIGDIFKSFALTFGEAEAFEVVGGLLKANANAGTTILGSQTADTFVLHGLVGGAFSAAGGGKFGAGFLAAGLGSFTPAPIAGQSFGQTVTGVVESAVLGGAGSVLGGGKFANGAVTGSFGYLFNELNDISKQFAINSDNPGDLVELGPSGVNASNRLQFNFGPGNFLPRLTVENVDDSFVSNFKDLTDLFNNPLANPTTVDFKANIMIDAPGCPCQSTFEFKVALPVGSSLSTPLSQDQTPISGPGRATVDLTNLSRHFTVIEFSLHRIPNQTIGK